MPAQQTKYETCLVDGVTGRGGVGDMRRRVAWAVVVLSIVAGTIVVLSPAANSSKKLDAYKSNTKELKSECADGGGDYVGSSKSGRLGTCMWPDGTETTCDNKKKGKNCTTYGRIVTDDGEFLDFVKGALADVSSVTVVTPDDTGASQQAGSPKKLIRRLLAKEDFEMTTQKLGRTCTNVLQADLITRINESPLVCMGDAVAIFCDTEKEGKSCTIEASTKGTRRMLQLIRRALVDPSSVTILVAPEGAAQPPSRGRRTTSSTTPSSTTPSSTTPSSTTPSSTTTNPPATTISSTSTTTTTGPAFL